MSYQSAVPPLPETPTRACRVKGCCDVVHILGHLSVFNYYPFAVSALPLGLSTLESDTSCIKCDREGSDLAYNTKRLLTSPSVSKSTDWLRVLCRGGARSTCWSFSSCEGSSQSSLRQSIVSWLEAEVGGVISARGVRGVLESGVSVTGWVSTMSSCVSSSCRGSGDILSGETARLFRRCCGWNISACCPGGSDPERDADEGVRACRGERGE